MDPDTKNIKQKQVKGGKTKILSTNLVFFTVGKKNRQFFHLSLENNMIS